ncbi:MAG: hypothetical protein KDF65_08540 [Anaerolineae bacterium]|nr:hypothetical protein [Anaerolineae bacterium]
MSDRLISSRILTFSLAVLAAIGGLFGILNLAAPAAAQEPTGEPTLSIQLGPAPGNFRLAPLNASAPTFEVGDRFTVSIVALGVETPGVFGSQFEVHYDTQFLAAVEGSLAPGAVMEPVVNAVNSIDSVNGVVKFAAGRQGDLENLVGDVVLATLTFEAVAPTEPPAGQTTPIALQNVKLGAKGGIAVPVSGIVGLDVVIRGDDTQPGPGDISGLVKVEGRAADNQAGNSVEAVGELGAVYTDTTEADASFWLNDVAADTYTMTASRPGFLTASCAGLSHTADALTNLAEVTLLAGDLDGNGTIDITDAVAIGAAFGTLGPDQLADLNGDEEVDVLDLILMTANFEQTSVGNPWLCQAAVEL